MPTYNAARTLSQTVRDIPRNIVDEVLLVDDAGADETVALARELGLTTFLHERNFGYGRNQKTCYSETLGRGADIVVMVHPDYQYSPNLIVPMAGMIAYGEYDVVMGFRILGIGALDRRNAALQIHCESVLNLIAKHSAQFQTLGISHGLSRFSTRGFGIVAVGGKL
jgi:glycosyltransferase involved in cell wall biosynthesis